MDRRSWPWKKKSNEKTATSTEIKAASLPNSEDNQTDQDDSSSVKYVQISVESYAHLTELEGQVKELNAKISDLNDKLSSADSEMITKENLVKQHAKVAEEAVSGWEKAEAEALALNHQLESVTLLKLTAEDRVSHLDGALKECMKKIRNVKEESEQKLHDTVFAKTKQWENAKAQLEARIADFEQELLRSSAENALLSRALQERSNLLMKISDEKSQADAEIEVMKNDIQTYDREVDSLKYELDVVSKELEIRNEEKNMSMRSADVTGKQHLEDVKKIAKLEAECQRLRGLVRKKLPGPAALAQMKLEVENLGRDYGETKLRRSPARSPSPHHISAPSDFALEKMQQCRKENEFLTARLLTMEEEMKMLKEALSNRNSELQASRSMCAKTASKLSSIEAQAVNQYKGPTKSITDIHFENQSNPANFISMSEDGIDEEGSCFESWPTALNSELSHDKKEKNVDKGDKANNSNHLELMDDFLEMEKLATLSTEVNGNIIIADGSADNADPTSSVDIQKDVGCNEQELSLELPTTINSPNVDKPSVDLAPDGKDYSTSVLQSRLACLLDSQTHDTDMRKLLEDIHQIVQDAQQELPQHSGNCVVDETNSTNDNCIQKECHEDIGEISKNFLKPNTDHAMDETLKDAISQILDFVSLVGKEAAESQGRVPIGFVLTEKIEKFSASVNKVLSDELNLLDFVVSLSHILSETSNLSCNMLSGKENEREAYSSDCIDKVTLLEKKVAEDEHARERFSGVCELASSSSDPDIEGSPALGFDLKPMLQKFSLEEFERLKLEKENIEIDLARCQETLELTKLQLVGKEKHLEDLKLQLSTCEKSNSLAGTQLKCMVESYKLLESLKQELESEVSMLHTKTEMLVTELEEEKNNHQDALAKCKELQEHIESKCSITSDADVGMKTKQEMEIAAAAEKLAECQETIFFLSRQLTSQASSSPSNMQQMSERSLEDEPSGSELINSQGMLSPHQLEQAEMENVTNITYRTGGVSPLNGYNSNISSSGTEIGHFPTSPLNLKSPKHRSSSSSSLSGTLPEKHGRGFSRFFSKGKE